MGGASNAELWLLKSFNSNQFSIHDSKNNVDQIFITNGSGATGSVVIAGTLSAPLISATGLGTSTPLSVNYASNNAGTLASFLAPALFATQTVPITFGKAASSNNGAQLFNTYTSSSSNTVGLRIFGTTGLAVDGSNNVSAAGSLTTTGSDIIADAVGHGYQTKEGSNAKQGTATLSAGTVTVGNTSVTANSRIFLTVTSLGTVTTPKAVAVTGRTAGTSFTITSADNTDTSTVAYEIFEPAP